MTARVTHQQLLNTTKKPRIMYSWYECQSGLLTVVWPDRGTIIIGAEKIKADGLKPWRHMALHFAVSVYYLLYAVDSCRM